MQKSNLGTEKIKTLFIRLVIPSVIAQLVSLIYNMVDRIYIGHIADVGSLALTGVGGLYAAGADDHRICQPGGRGRRTAGFDRPGKRGPGRGGADFRKLFSVCHPAQRCADGGVPGIFPAAAGVVWSQ